MFRYHVASLKAEWEAGIIPDIDQWLADKMLDQVRPDPPVVEAHRRAGSGADITTETRDAVVVGWIVERRSPESWNVAVLQTAK